MGRPTKRFDASSWKVDDADWVRRREAQWPSVQADLSFWAFPRHELRRLKDYFLRGKIVPTHNFRDPRRGGPMPFVFLVWLHPKPTRALFKQLASAADGISMEYSEYCVGKMAYTSFPTFDAVAPMFYELFYRRESEWIMVDGVGTGRVSHQFGPCKVWAYYISWVMCEVPNRNPICRFLMTRLEQLTEQEALKGFKRFYPLLKNPRAFTKKLQQLERATDDPRHESVRKLVSMLKTGKLPKALGLWLKKHGLRY